MIKKTKTKQLKNGMIKKLIKRKERAYIYISLDGVLAHHMGVMGEHAIPTCVLDVSTTLSIIIELRHLNTRGFGHDCPYIAIDHQGMNGVDNSGYNSYK